MSTTTETETPAAADLRTLADLAATHPELDSEITAAVAELHIVLSASDMLTPNGLAKIVLAAGGRIVDDPVHADNSFDTAEVSLPAGVITLNVHKMRPGGPMLAPKVAPDGPVDFHDQPTEAAMLRATITNLADELDALFRAPDRAAYSHARTALIHRLQDVRQR